MKKLCFLFLIILSFQIMGCGKKEIKLSKPQRIFFEKDTKYPVRIGLKINTEAITFSSSDGFKIVDATTDSVIYTEGTNGQWLCLFPQINTDISGSETWRLQVAAFRNQEGVDTYLEELKRQAIAYNAFVFFDGGWFKVRVGNFSSRDEVMKFKKNLPSQYSDSFPVKISILAEEIDNLEIVSPDKKFTKIFQKPIKIIPLFPNKLVEFNDKFYRGNIEFGITKYNKSYAVNELPLDDYLKGVLPAEMNPSWGMEALKAQAVAARTQTITRLGKHREENFDLCDSEHCQVYKGVAIEREKTNRAIEETSGEILIYDGKVIEAVYSANCGGHTESAKAIWGNEYSYLVGTRDFPSEIGTNIPNSEKGWEAWILNPPKAFCQNHDSQRRKTFRWEVALSREELEGKIGHIGNIRDIIPRERGRSGRITKVTVVGTKGTVDIEKELNIRRTFGNLKSSCFFVKQEFSSDTKLPDQFILFGAGYGHGVGMCQTGAAGMADLGYGYREILQHYYRGTQIINFEKLLK